MTVAKPQLSTDELVRILSRELWQAKLAIEKLQSKCEILEDEIRIMREHIDIMKKKIQQ
jgi:SMC interacting uncharacterized protein involved in chromosome segregation